MFFFFSSRRRHTRSKRDWSSDVCSSDLWHIRAGSTHSSRWDGIRGQPLQRHSGLAWRSTARQRPLGQGRSEERRVGKECRCRRAPDHEKKKKKKSEHSIVEGNVTQ